MKKEEVLTGVCQDCKEVLNADESFWYGFRCEECEIKYFNRLDAWHKGGEDEELDEKFNFVQRLFH